MLTDFSGQGLAARAAYSTASLPDFLFAFFCCRFQFSSGSGGPGAWWRPACSAAGELGVGENSAAVESVRVLRDIRDVQVILGLAETLSDLRIDVVLRLSLSRIVELLALVGIPVLLALPHEGRLLGRHFEHGWVKRLDHGVARRSLLGDDFL